MTVNMTTWGIGRLKSVDPIAANNFCQSTQSKDGPSLRSKDKMANSSLMKGVLDLADARLRKFKADKQQMMRGQMHVGGFTSAVLLSRDVLNAFLGHTPLYCVMGVSRWPATH